MENHDNNPKIFHIFAKLLDGKTATLRFASRSADAGAIKRRIFEITKIPADSQRLLCGGTQLTDQTIIWSPDSTVHLVLRLPGGKGGFGSLLRGAATKAGQKKTNNFDACRDMSGRRLRHVNAEKRLEEWKAEEEERRLEKIAEEFIKKKAKKGKKGAGDGEAEKYVETYREQSAKCAAAVEEAVREACGNGKRKKGSMEAVDSKRLKIWMGKRKLVDRDSEGMEEDSSDDEDEKDEKEKSVVLNNGNLSDLNKDAEGSSDSVTGGKLNGECSAATSCVSGSEEEKEIDEEQSLKSNSSGEIVPNEEVEPEIHTEIAIQSARVTHVDVTEISKLEAVKDEKLENGGPDSQLFHALSSENGEVTKSEQLITGTDSSSDSKVESNEEAAVASTDNTAMEKPLNFDEFSSATDLEVLGMERLKNELQSHGLKCGGTLQERAARLFLLKATPLEKLPKKLLAKK